MRGFLEEMSAQDVPTTAPILGDWTADFGYYAGRELLTVRDFTAIFASNDQMALGLMHAVRDAGLEIPRDVSIIGFDDIPEAAHFWPPLTTVRQDFAELGRRCVALLLGDIERSSRTTRRARPSSPSSSFAARPGAPRSEPRCAGAGCSRPALSIRDLDELTVRSRIVANMSLAM